MFCVFWEYCFQCYSMEMAKDIVLSGDNQLAFSNI